MYQLPIIFRQERTFIASPLHRQKAEGFIVKLLFSIFIIDLLLLTGLVIKFYFLEGSVPKAVASTTMTTKAFEDSSVSAALGSETQSFINHLNLNGAAITAMKPIKRSPFTVPGEMIMLNGNNIQVFEYPDNASATSAAKSAPKVAKRYMAHAYVNDKLVIFYMGNQSAILSLLDPLN